MLVTGATGGVGSLAIKLLSKIGYEAAAVTGKADQAAYLTRIRAAQVIDRADFLKDALSAAEGNLRRRRGYTGRRAAGPDAEATAPGQEPLRPAAMRPPVICR